MNVLTNFEEYWKTKFDHYYCPKGFDKAKKKLSGTRIGAYLMVLGLDLTAPVIWTAHVYCTTEIQVSSSPDNMVYGLYVVLWVVTNNRIPIFICPGFISRDGSCYCAKEMYWQCPRNKRSGLLHPNTYDIIDISIVGYLSRERERERRSDSTVQTEREDSVTSPLLWAAVEGQLHD